MNGFPDIQAIVLPSLVGIGIAGHAGMLINAGKSMRSPETEVWTIATARRSDQAALYPKIAARVFVNPASNATTHKQYKWNA